MASKRVSVPEGVVTPGRAAVSEAAPTVVTFTAAGFTAHLAALEAVWAGLREPVSLARAGELRAQVQAVIEGMRGV